MLNLKTNYKKSARTNWALAYANIFMGKLMKKHSESKTDHFYNYDISIIVFVIWTDSLAKQWTLKYKNNYTSG